MKAAIAILGLSLGFLANATEFASKEVLGTDGTKGSIVVRIDDFGTYSALFRKIQLNTDVVVCETIKNSYWERTNGEWRLLALGKAQIVPCASGKACMLIQIVKSAPLFSGESIELSEAPAGTLKQTPSAPICK